MSKEQEARVRDELLQTLYAAALRCTLAARGSRGELRHGAAAGVGANLLPGDLLLLPQQGATALRLLRGLPGAAKGALPVRDRAAGVLPLPQNEAAAAAYTLGAAAALVHAGNGAIVCVLLPAGVSLQGGRPVTREKGLPATWADAAGMAARMGLPLLLISGGPGRRPRNANAHLQPAPPYPSIPVDRDDALAAYRVVYECIGRARAGGGPSHLVCVPFQVRGQHASDRGALARLESMLRKRGAFSKAWRRDLERKLIRELAGGE